MSIPLWVSETAEWFWATAGAVEPFPRNLRRAVAQALPLAVVLIPEMTLGATEMWLQRQGAAYSIRLADRPLRACLIARHGHGFIFIDGADPEDEQRFSLAHELAHFLHDYFLPRYRAVRRLGEGIVDVLDGLRPAEVGERAGGLLVDVAVKPFFHLMNRSGDDYPNLAIKAAEDAADRLAFELLAPWDTVMGQIGSHAGSRPQMIADLLVGNYGLPPAPAAQYAQLLAPAEPTADPLLSHLRAGL